ncbi:serine hydrolase domain-containing protein [Noviherbaspirillum galbum]|uniref:Beta-lactamase family protein n=1 Tax=Noviherbaspirillum galbum TaxID=2709383 RepID=A0A6B3SP70_9BURK|nr:serine hydrolase domain-containing protein [Noviherbaspirillum galbum]NEX62308.1 beta-lactamase family protein [Noviherbaspirillum galbum]
MTLASGFDASRLDLLTRRFQEDIAAGRIPGAAMLIHRHGRTVYDEALGVQDPASGKPLAKDTIFRIYSMTKPVVSVAIMKLAEQGRLMISDPISRFLPELGELAVGVEKRQGAQTVLALEPAVRPVTIQDLLRHTSGFTYGIFGDSLVKTAYRDAGVGRMRASNDEFIRTLAGLPLAYQPGTVWEYSVSTDVLGVILERAHGKPLDEVLKQEIFDPLGMTDTDFWVTPDRFPRLAQAFDTDPVTGVAVKLNGMEQRPNFLSGGGGLASTMSDYLKFARMLMQGGELDGVRIIGRKTLAWMTSDHLGDLPAARTGANYLPGPGYGFGLGFAVRLGEGGAVLPGSTGDFTWSGLAGTYFWIDPREDLLAILLMQAPEQRTYYRQMFRGLVYGALD